MEKKLNLFSMLFLFMCVVGFDHFYRGVMTKNHTLVVSPNSHSLMSNYEIAPMVPPTIMAKYHHKIAKLR